jgi:hypothetical protein
MLCVCLGACAESECWTCDVASKFTETVSDVSEDRTVFILCFKHFTFFWTVKMKVNDHSKRRELLDQHPIVIFPRL